MKDTHPFKPFIPPNATKLIIGTIPPHRFCIDTQLLPEDVRFYYGSQDNEFWHLVGEVSGFDFPFENSDVSITRRTEFLEEKGIGITDIIKSCNRVNESSSDNQLKDIEYKDICGLLKSNPKIDTLLYTSGFVKICMNRALKTYHSIDKEDRHKQSVMINEKKYTVWILFSPSPQALRGLGKDGAKQRKEQYKMIFDHFNIL